MKTNRLMAAAAIITALGGASFSAFANHAFLGPNAVISKESRHIVIHPTKAMGTTSSGSTYGSASNQTSGNTTHQAMESNTERHVGMKENADPTNTGVKANYSAGFYGADSLHRGG